MELKIPDQKRWVIKKLNGKTSIEKIKLWEIVIDRYKGETIAELGKWESIKQELVLRLEEFKTAMVTNKDFIQALAGIASILTLFIIVWNALR